MKKWRIVETERYASTTYIIQKRFLGFLWWYNPLNIDAYCDGVFNDYDVVKHEFDELTSPVNKSVVFSK